MKRQLLTTILITAVAFSLISCGAGKGTGNAGTPKEGSKTAFTMTVTPEVIHQTFDGFGTSSCWWSQYVGGWDEPYAGEAATATSKNADSGGGAVDGDNSGAEPFSVRDRVARWLYSRDEGIGLTIYRYNVGAGSKDSGLGDIPNPDRRAESFIGSDGNYDWSKDENAVWFLRRCVELGAKDVVFFCNSPLDRLTMNGLAHMSKDTSVNLAPENYGAFADYVFDVAEHFRSEGIPVTMISPINEPQWDWKDGQEGCHYSPDETVGVLKAFVAELRERNLDDKIEITSPESGEWKASTKPYFEAILKDPELSGYFTKLDGHSYWSGRIEKKGFKSWMDEKFPGVGLAMSEWCEMVNGRDWTMDSAFNMADCIWEDLTILNVSSWQYWVGVADGDYRDGLIYVEKAQKTAKSNRRLWSFGNYSKFIRPGFVRIDYGSDNDEIDALHPVVFTGIDDDGREKCVAVFINRGDEVSLAIKGIEGYTDYEVYTTAQDLDLVKTAEGTVDSGTSYTVAKESITTVILSK